MVTLFAGRLRPLPPDGTPTGIFKTALSDAVWVGLEGFAGDMQADRRVHGGPEKALHQYPVASYARLAEAFPEAAPLLVPGSLGENISADDWGEGNMSIGDLFRLGESVIQVCQPRTPCWKIDARFGVKGMGQFIHETGLTGWYFRVIKEGVAAPGCEFRLLGKDANCVTVEQLLTLWRGDAPAPEALEAIAAHPALSPNWVKKLNDRAREIRQAS